LLAVPANTRLLTERHPTRGFLYIALATLQWGIAASMGRAVFTGRLRIGGEVVGAMSPMVLAQGRGTFSFFLLLVFLLARRGWRSLALPKLDIGRVLLIGVAGMAASNYFYYLAIQRTNVATAIIVQYTAPVWVLLYMVGHGLQKATLKRVGAVGMVLAGIALVIDLFGRGGFRADAIGVGAALLAAFSFSFYNIAVHGVLRRHDRWKILLWVLMAATIFWAIANPPWHWLAAGYTRGQILFLCAFSLISMVGPFSFYFAGLQHLEPTQAVVASCLEPVFAILVAAIALGEHVSLTQGLGVALVLLAVVVIQRPERYEKESAVVEPIE
jgi:drug/metabolite transporter, DME family